MRMIPLGSEFHHERFARLQGDVVGEVDLAAGDDIGGCGGLADDLSIAGYGHGGLASLAVENGQRRAALILASDDVDAFEGDELCLLSLADEVVALTPVEQFALPLEHGVLGLGAALGGEAVVRVTGETAGEVASYIAVGDLLGAVHQHLCTVVELWDAIHRQQQGESLFQSCRVFAIAKESVGVVVLDEGQHVRRVGIEIVIAETVVDAVESLPPVVGLLVLGLIELVEETEVHNGFQIG